MFDTTGNLWIIDWNYSGYYSAFVEYMGIDAVSAGSDWFRAPTWASWWGRVRWDLLRLIACGFTGKYRRATMGLNSAPMVPVIHVIVGRHGFGRITSILGGRMVRRLMSIRKKITHRLFFSFDSPAICLATRSLAMQLRLAGWRVTQYECSNETFDSPARVQALRKLANGPTFTVVECIFPFGRKKSRVGPTFVLV